MFDSASASSGVKLALLEGQLLTGATEPKVQFEFSERLAAQEKAMIEAALRETKGRVFVRSGAATNGQVIHMLSGQIEEEGEQAMACLTSERSIEMSLSHGKQSAVDFAERVRGNQRKLRDDLTSQYDFRLAENPDVSVLLLEAGGSDVPSVTEAARWFENLGSERDWKFVDQPNSHLKGRSMPLSMGGCSSYP